MIDECKNDPEKSFTKKLSEYIPSGFSMHKILSLEITMMYTETKIG